MALSAKLVMRQGQSLVMTPQLLQAIKLLQLSNLELATFIEEELERNPLLERADDRPEPGEHQSPPDDTPKFAEGDPIVGDWNSDEFMTDHATLETSLGTEVGNTFDIERSERSAETTPDLHGLTATSWNSTGGTAPDGVVEAIEHPGYRFCLGVQWHPEYAVDPRDPDIFRAFVAACREAARQRAGLRGVLRGGPGQRGAERDGGQGGEKKSLHGIRIE